MPQLTRIYLDHAATTAVDPRVLKAMLPYWTEHYGNPASLYDQGRGAAEGLNRARKQVAGILGCNDNEIVFTSCGTESDNLAIRGVTTALRRKGKHIITTTIEHHAILRTCEQLEQLDGYKVTYLPVDAMGMVDPDDVRKAIRPDTVLISVMYANNEIGTIQPIAEIGAIARKAGVVFHTDAVQAGGSLPLDVDQLNVDLLSLSGHKFYAPKGVGVLYIRRGTPIVPIQTGGGQERGMRAGTSNVPYIVGLGEALVLAHQDREQEQARLAALRDRLIKGVLTSVPDSCLNGHPTQRLANNANFIFAGIEGEAVQMKLDWAGIACGTGSACASEDDEPSHVLVACGIKKLLSRASIRFTLGRENTEIDVDRVIEILPPIVQGIRDLSPIYRIGMLS